MSPSSASLKEGEDLAQSNVAVPDRPWASGLLSWLGANVSKAAGRLRAMATAATRSVKALVSRAIESVRAKVGSPIRLAKSLFMAAVGKDHGFGFWWLMVMAAIALAIGVLVTVLLSPVLGLLAALAVGIWMLIRRSRASHSRDTAAAGVAS